MNNKKVAFVALLVILCGVLNFLYVSLFLQGGVRPSFNADLNFTTEKQFQELNKIMGFEESFVDVNKKNDSFSIYIKGRREFPIEKLDEFLKTDLHISEELSIYSLVFVNNFLNIIDLNDEVAFRKLSESISAVLINVNKRDLLPNKMKFNDHVVAVRMETLIKFIAYAEQFHKNIYSQELQKLVNTNIKWAHNVLSNDDYFTWRTNHGLMQVRALLAYGYAFENLDMTHESNLVASERAAELLDFHIASDGSVFESASSYWYYIYDQWNKISIYDNIEKSVAQKIQKRLEQTEFFLNTVTFSNGFLQGVGDATNRYISTGRNESMQNKIFQFENGISGFHFFDSNANEIGVLFTSLHNPPNVHKHPEDLSMYLYYNQQPFFINPGVFAYDGSSQRRFLRSQEAQNTIYSINNTIPDSSKLQVPQINENNVVLGGEKYYNGYKIARKIIFNQKSNKIIIEDSTQQGLSSKINYNIHPEVKIKKSDKFTLTLQADSSEIELKFSEPYKLGRSIISRSFSKLDSIDQVTIQCEKLKTTIELSEFNFNLSYSYQDKYLDPTNKRYDLYKELTKKYNNSLYLKQSPKRIIFPRVIFLFSCMFFLYLFSKMKTSDKLYKLFFFLVLFVYILDFFQKGLVLSLSFLI